ncbi:hypothetical protein LOZ65_000245 [Ophidiomyces ophidiicola]|nr:hypothetical protein LOZ65_000245 [Ophidiomyces ophidiicola]
METTSSKHRRNASLRSTRPRSSTKGPLDMPNDMDSEAPTHTSQDQIPTAAGQPISSARSSVLSTFSLPVHRNFSFLLRPEIYHPLVQLDIPPALRSDFPKLPESPSLQPLLLTLDELLNGGHFLLAAHISALILTSSAVSPNDHVNIFSLFYTRLACLELSGKTLLAAQEVKAMEDLSSAFYYVDGDTENRSHHLVPWPLRVLAVRLQSIGFGDARRGITGLYELGLEAREQISRPEIGHEEKEMWRSRLSDLGIRVVNALIEMGDLDAARRSLNNMQASQNNGSGIARMALLYLRIGDLDSAKILLEASPRVAGGILYPLLSMAEGRFIDAVTEWRDLYNGPGGKDNEVLLMQNLAVCLLYVGKLSESREILETLVERSNSFQSLTLNLATIYELCLENPHHLKVNLTQRVADQEPSRLISRERPSSTFKITN